MLEILNLNNPLYIFLTLLFIIIRVSAVVAFAPVFSQSSIPAQVKIAFIVLFSVALYPAVKDYISIEKLTVFGLAAVVMKEVLLGAALGFTVHFLWAGLELGAQLLGFMMGFSIANVLSPEENVQISILSEFESIVAILVFLAIDGHHIFIKAIADSFKIMPVGGFILNQNMFDMLNRLVALMFGVSFRILAPAIIALIITNIVFGIIARTMPQVNILIVAFPLSIGIGLFVIGASLQYSVFVLIKYYDNVLSSVYAILRLGHG